MYKLLLALLLLTLAPRGLFAQDRFAGNSVQIQPLGAPQICLDARQGRAFDGDPVQVYPCNGTNHQQWTITASPDNRHALIGVGGFCLDVRGTNSTQTGTPAQLWQCHFGDNQRFAIQPDGRIIEIRSRKCLAASAPRDSAPVILAPCQNLPGEVWAFTAR